MHKGIVARLLQLAQGGQYLRSATAVLRHDGSSVGPHIAGLTLTDRRGAQVSCVTEPLHACGAVHTAKWF